MADFVIYTVIGLSALAGLTLLVIAAIITYGALGSLYNALVRKPEILPAPDKAARRVFDQHYFDKAVSRE